MRYIIYSFLLLTIGNNSFNVDGACTVESDCAEGQWCSPQSEGSNFCKNYAALGESCNRRTIPENFGLCKPSIHFCYEPESCIIADGGGTCVDESQLLKDGDCCNSNDKCESGICSEGETFIGTLQNVCQAGNLNPYLVDMISSISGLIVYDPLSYQHQALNWLIQDQLIHQTKENDNDNDNDNGTNALFMTNVRISQRYVLMLLFFSLSGDDWSQNNQYGSDTNECDWFGVTCLDSKVIELNLEKNKLFGSIVSEIGELTALETINLKNNRLLSNIPESPWEKLTNLKTLTLRSNDLDGSIPTSIGFLSLLEELHVYRNKLSGSLPKELFSLTSLVALSLQNNKLIGTLPKKLGEMENLEYLRLSGNKLTGSIPSSIRALKSIQYLSLRDNAFSGKIPSSIGNLGLMEFMDLSKNELTGRIPSRIGELSELVNLHLQHNNLQGTLPTELGNLSKLESLFLHENNLRGKIYNKMCGLSIDKLVVDCAGEEPEVECECCSKCV